MGGKLWLGLYNRWRLIHIYIYTTSGVYIMQNTKKIGEMVVVGKKNRNKMLGKKYKSEGKKEKNTS